MLVDVADDVVDAGLPRFLFGGPDPVVRLDCLGNVHEQLIKADVQIDVGAEILGQRFGERSETDQHPSQLFVRDLSDQRRIAEHADQIRLLGGEPLQLLPGEMDHVAVILPVPAAEAVMYLERVQEKDRADRQRIRLISDEETSFAG